MPAHRPFPLAEIRAILDGSRRDAENDVRCNQRSRLTCRTPDASRCGDIHRADLQFGLTRQELFGTGGSAKIAPNYDLMCAAVYRQVDQSQPQGIGGRFIAPDLRSGDWKALSEDVGLSAASTLKRVKELAELVARRCDQSADSISAILGDPTRVLDRLTHQIQKRCKRIQHQL